MPTTRPAPSRTANRLLWVVQILLAALFVFAGGFKLVTPIGAMTQQMPMPGLFLRFIGVAELAGGLGLVLPGLFRIRPGLTPLAAGGLVIIMSGAVGVTLAIGGGSGALVPGLVGLLAAGVAMGRWGERAGAATARPRGRVELRAA
jgi:uncharacterized membrane protein YphA (DoxX/SURF4 family)